jgi:NADPH:quinone reductase
MTPFDIGLLSREDAPYLTRRTLATYTVTWGDREATASEVFRAVLEGTIRIGIRHRYPLSDAVQVYRD